MILAGDVGGTNIRLALFDRDPRVPVAFGAYRTEAAVPLERVIREFLAEHPVRVEHVGFGTAGVIRDGRCIDATNLPWLFDDATIAASAGVEEAVLLNDVEAAAHGLALLRREDLVTLNGGDADPDGNSALLSAGTGLGQAGIVRDGERRHIFAAEGGNADFAPRSAFEQELRDSLGGHVSYERVCSGIGLVNIYRHVTGAELEPAAITRLALDGDAAASRSLDALVSIFGAWAGNVALTLMATGGVFISGGVALRILPRLRRGPFMDAFLATGVISSLVEQIPVHVVVNEQLTLIGAARVAAPG